MFSGTFVPTAEQRTPHRFPAACWSKLDIDRLADDLHGAEVFTRLPSLTQEQRYGRYE
jgi:hypothetical protein